MHNSALYSTTYFMDKLKSLKRLERLVKRKVILVGILLASTNCCSETLGDNLLNGSIFMIFSNSQIVKRS